MKSDWAFWSRALVFWDQWDVGLVKLHDRVGFVLCNWWNADSGHSWMCLLCDCLCAPSAIHILLNEVLMQQTFTSSAPVVWLFCFLLAIITFTWRSQLVTQSAETRNSNALLLAFHCTEITTFVIMIILFDLHVLWYRCRYESYMSLRYKTLTAFSLSASRILRHFLAHCLLFAMYCIIMLWTGQPSA